MTTVLDTIPEALTSEVGAAVDWFNRQQGAEFKVTGIIDPPAAEAPTRELRLVLCGADTCRQENFRVTPAADGFAVELADAAGPTAGDVPELDPPPGPRREWIDAVSQRHRFVVLLFYRGFW